MLGDLSTFSAHSREPERRSCERRTPPGAGRAPARVLVLLDELMAGISNPEQGAALARATAGRRWASPAGARWSWRPRTPRRAEGAARGGHARSATPAWSTTPTKPDARRSGCATGTPGAVVRARHGRADGRCRRPLLGRARRSWQAACTAALERRHRHAGGSARPISRAGQRRRFGCGARGKSWKRARRGPAHRARRARRSASASWRWHSRAAIELRGRREAREAIRAIVRQAQEAGSSRAAEAARARLDETARTGSGGFPGAGAGVAPAGATALQPRRARVPFRRCRPKGPRAARARRLRGRVQSAPSARSRSTSTSRTWAVRRSPRARRGRRRHRLRARVRRRRRAGARGRRRRVTVCPQALVAQAGMRESSRVRTQRARHARPARPPRR